MDGLQQRIDDTARWCLRAGLSVIPIIVSDDPEHDKKAAIKWKENIDKPLADWRFRGCNIALLTGQFNGIVVADCDSQDSYVGWLKTKTPTPLRVRTKRGMQFYYKHPGQYIKSGWGIKDPAGFKYDVKGDRSYVLFPPSVRDGYQYQICVCTGNIAGRLFPFDRLPVFNPEWRPETVNNSIPADTPAIRDACAYIGKIFAVSGEGGDNQTFRAACKLTESGMSESEALAALVGWNQTNATPPWTAHELLHKVRCAMKESR